MLLASSAVLLSVALTAPTALAEPPGSDLNLPAPAVSETVSPTDQPATTSPTTSQSTPPSTSGQNPATSTSPSEAPGTTDPSTSASSTPSQTPERRQSAVAVAPGCQTYPPTTFEVCGRIKDKYNQTGGPSGFLLFPKSNELTNPGNTGKRSEFLGGNIYWSVATDAHPVAHDFLTEWGNNGYETGYLKYPTTDEIVLAQGRRQEFQGGGIFWSLASGAHMAGPR